MGLGMLVSNRHRDTDRPIPTFWLNAIDGSFTYCEEIGRTKLDAITQRDTHWFLYQFCSPLEKKHGRLNAERRLCAFMQVYGFVITPLHITYASYLRQGMKLRDENEVISELVSFIMKRITNMGDVASGKIC